VAIPVNRRARRCVLGDVGHPDTTRASIPAGLAQAAAAGLQLLLLAGLAAVSGLGPVGLLVGLAYTAGLLGLLGAAVHHAGRPLLGPADVVTLARALLVGGVTALVADGLVSGTTATTDLVVLAAVALALDAVDGQVARRTRTASAVGARFDMEVDAFLIVVLSAHVAAAVGAWALAIGAMRYAFVAAGWALPWLRGPLPPSYAGKTVAALQGIVLVVVGAGVLGGSAAVVPVAAALALLCWSFGRDVLRLHRGQAREARGREARVPLPRQAALPDRTPVMLRLDPVRDGRRGSRTPRPCDSARPYCRGRVGFRNRADHPSQRAHRYLSVCSCRPHDRGGAGVRADHLLLPRPRAERLPEGPVPVERVE
jgi:phosphatidylglycerophosphate synthase